MSKASNYLKLSHKKWKVKESESVISYAMRLRDLKTKMAMCSKNGASFINHELFEKYLLQDFLRGLKSSFMVNRVISKEAKSISDALLIIESELAKEKKKEYYNSNQQDSSLASDKQLYSNSQNAKMYANNSLFAEGELDFEGELVGNEEINEQWA